MSNNVIKCPNCGSAITLSEALTEQIKSGARSELEAEFKEKEKQWQKQIEDANAKESALKKREQEIDTEVNLKIETEKKKIAGQEFENAKKSLQVEMGDLQDQLRDVTTKLEESKKTELALRKRERELEEAKQNLELETERRVAQEKDKIRKQALEAAAEQQKLRFSDYENQIKGLKDQIDILKQKAEQGPEQAQGETLELELEEALKKAFPEDNINPVPKGREGGDVIHEVCDSKGIVCGTILWETKRTKRWSDSWIEKTKSDQRKAKADLSVIISIALPKGVDSFDYIMGVWVTGFSSAMGLALALRQNLIHVASAKASSVGKEKKLEVLYKYLSGPEFKGRVESMVEAFIALKKELDQEKRAISKLWAQREKQIETVVINLSGMYGDFQGIIGASLPQIKQLEIKALPEPKE